MSSGTEGWERQFDKLFQIVKLKTRDNIAIKQRLLNAALAGLNAQFMSQFLSQAFGVSSTPGYARDQGVSWKPLTEKYVKRKGHSNFYEKTGKLKNYMNLWNYSRAFGNDKTSLMLRAAGTSTTGRAPAGGAFTGTGRFFRGGQFTPKDDPAEWLPVGIKVELFPDLKGTGQLWNNEASAKDIEAAVFGKESLTYFKLNNPGGGRNKAASQRFRPAFGTFTLWWLKHKTQAVLQRFDPTARIFR